MRVSKETSHLSMLEHPLTNGVRRDSRGYPDRQGVPDV